MNTKTMHAYMSGPLTPVNRTASETYSIIFNTRPHVGTRMTKKDTYKMRR